LRSTVGGTPVFGRRTDPVLRSACSRGVTTMWVNRPPQVSQLGQLSLWSFWVDKWVAGQFIGRVLWRHLGNACEVTALLIGCWQNLGAVCFWQPIPGLNLVVAVLRDSLTVVIVPCVADVYRVFYVRLSGCLNYIKGKIIIIIITSKNNFVITY